MTAPTFSLQIRTPHATLFQRDDITMVIVPGSQGDLGVMAGHLPVLTTLRAGKIDVRQGEVSIFSMYVHAHNQASVHIEQTGVSVLLNYFCPLEAYVAYTYKNGLFDDSALGESVRIESRTYGDYRIQRAALLTMTELQHGRYQDYARGHKNPTLVSHCIE